MNRDGIARAVAACGFTATCMLVIEPLYAEQQDPADERIKRLERQLEAVTQELQKLKEEVAAKRKASAPATVDQTRKEQPDESQVQPAIVQREGSAPAVTETQALRQDVNELKGELAAVQEQAAAADAKAEQSGVRAYLGPGLVFEDPRGRWRMQVSARVQLDYRAYQPSFTNADTFSIRRARIGVGATLLDDYGIYVEEEFANQATSPAPATGPQLTFAYIDLNWFRPGVRFRLGQFKPYMGLDNTMLDLQTDFLERALTQSLFQNLTYDSGLMAFGQPAPGLFYSAALTNGTGQGNNEPQGNLQQVQGDGKMYTLRLVNDFAQTFKVAQSVFHLGGTYQSGGIANSGANNQTPYTAASVQTEARGLTFFIPQAFNPTTAAAVNSNIDRSAIDLEAAFAYRSYKIQSDYVQVDYTGSNLASGADFDRSLKAYYVTLGWLISGEHYSDWYRDGTFVRPRPRNNFGWGKGDGWGLWEANFRYSWFDGGDFNNGNPQFTGRLGTSASFPNITQTTNGAHSYTLGLKWLPNLYTRFMLNLIRTEFDTPVVVNGQSTDYENAITVRAQVDF
jgi:phosphate-selective porin OprO and OprP